MPIPTRSQSVKSTTSTSKSRLPEPNEKVRPDNGAKKDTVPHSSLPRTATTGLVDKHARTTSIPAPRNNSHTNTETRSTTGLSTKTSSIPKPPFNKYQQSFDVKEQTQLKKPRIPNQTDTLPKSADLTEEQRIPNLQNEVLQLSIVHDQASKTLNRYEETINRKISEQRHDLRVRHEGVVSLERDLQRQLNRWQLSSWLTSDGKSTISVDKTRNLAFCISEIEELSGEAGIVNRILHEFEEWQSDARSRTVQQQHQCHNAQAFGGLQLIQPLSSVLHIELSTIYDRLTVCRHTLLSLGVDDKAAILARIVQQHIRLVDILIDEIETCGILHQAMLAQQDAWLTAKITSIISTEQLIQGNDQPCQRTGLWEVHGSI